MNYNEFLQRKRVTDAPSGLTVVPPLNPKLFEFQRDITSWALRRGRANVWADCGLGKTIMQLQWCFIVMELTGKPVMIVAPLAVSHQTKREGEKFGFEVNVCDCQDDVKLGINITNYEKLHKFDLSAFGAFALDESGILKNYAGSMRNEIIERSSIVPFRSGWSATPAPNDYMELGNHSEFCGVMSRMEMLAMFFVHDGGDTSQWRLKGHAEAEFWKWLCSFSVMVRRPSDLGYSDDGFVLPPLNIHDHIVESGGPCGDYLFEMPALTLQERRRARQNSIEGRCRAIADLATSTSDPFIMWCDLNEESRRLAKMTSAYEITGSMSDQDKERGLLGFQDGTYNRIVTKARIAGWGMNYQHCQNVGLCGLSDSYEAYYQIVRRCWRFGQLKPVNVHLSYSSTEGPVVQNVRRKDAEADRMYNQMVQHMRAINTAEIHGTKREKTDYTPKTRMEKPSWIAA